VEAEKTQQKAGPEESGCLILLHGQLSGLNAFPERRTNTFENENRLVAAPADRLTGWRK